MTAHPLATSALGGHAGYKQGGMGVIDGEPCVYGVLFRRGIVGTDATLSMSEWNLFGAEPEIGFVIGDALPPLGRDRDTAEILAAVGKIVPVIEVCGRRHAVEASSGVVTPIQCLGDASCAACVAVGDAIDTGDDVQCTSPLELASMTVTLCVNGEAVASGGGDQCPLGGPLASLTWCANHLNRRGRTLEAGALVISGAMCKFRAFGPGDTLSAKFVHRDGSMVAEVTTHILP